jgi:hypothetical protein
MPGPTPNDGPSDPPRNRRQARRPTPSAGLPRGHAGVAILLPGVVGNCGSRACGRFGTAPALFRRGAAAGGGKGGYASLVDALVGDPGREIGVLNFGHLGGCLAVTIGVVTTAVGAAVKEQIELCFRVRFHARIDTAWRLVSVPKDMEEAPNVAGMFAR